MGLFSTNAARKAPQPSLPHGDELKMHLREIAAVNDLRTELSRKHELCQQDVGAAEAAAARVQALRGEVDAVLADARYRGADAPDVSDKQRELVAAVAEADRLASVARAAEAAGRRYVLDASGLNIRLDALRQKTPRLIHAALIEKIIATAPAFREAEEQFRATVRDTMRLALAADTIALANGFQQFCASGAYGDFFIPRPPFDPFRRGPIVGDAYAVQQEHVADLRRLQCEADAVVMELLKTDD